MKLRLFHGIPNIYLTECKYLNHQTVGIVAQRSQKGPRMSNRLSMEHSPYLLQHAENPVDWRLWGPEVFEEANHSDKPIF